MPTVQNTTPASVAGPQHRSGRWGAHHCRVANMQRGATTATATRKARGKVSKSCAWPAYARSAAKAEAEALAAVRSLYADELKPFGRILRKRVAEKILENRGIVADITNLDVLPEVDGKQVRAVCDACEQLCTAEEEGGDWSAVFVDRPQTFVDIYSPTDCYDEQFWSGLRACFEGPHRREISLPGGRYGCAQALKALELPLFAGFSLGRICHVVQLAMSQKKILGYMDGAMVPYARSQGMMKDQCAMHAQPSTCNINDHQSNTLTLPIASLEVARKHLCEILDTANGELPLSNVKRLFRSRFQIDLSETSFGCSKLSELLQDSKFSDICRVELRSHGYTVIRVGENGDCPAALLQDGARSVPLMNVPTEDVPVISIPTSTSTEVMDQAAPQWCCSPSEHICDDFVACSVQHTFLQFKVPGTPLPGSRRRSHSLPKDMGRSEKPLASETLLPESKAAFACCSVALSKHVDADESTSDGSDVESLSHKGSSSSCSTEFNSNEALHAKETIHQMCTLDSDLERRRVIFCPDEPLELEEAGFISAPLQLSPKLSPLSNLLPSIVQPSPVQTPCPLDNYSDLANQHLVCSSLPQVLPILLFAVPASSTEIGFTQNYSLMAPIRSEETLPPAHPGSSCSSTSNTLGQPLHPGCIIRLGEYIR